MGEVIVDVSVSVDGFVAGIGTWGEDGAFGRPSFVVTSREREDLVRGPTTFTFVTEGVEVALDRARTVAGEQDVVIVGGAESSAGARRRAVDELRLHVIPVLLGAGVPLFNGSTRPAELEPAGAVATPNATHLTFRVA